jgi:hypothetical protein
MEYSAAPLITIMQHYTGEGIGAIIRIMLQIHDGIWNTGAPYHNHATLLKVRCWVMLDLHDYVDC